MENFNQVHSQWSNIPEELRMRNNWCISGSNKVPMYHDRDGQLVRADVTNPATWMSFDYACGLLEALPQYNVGFVLQSGAGLACIDLDVVNEQTQLAKGKPVDASQWDNASGFRALLVYRSALQQLHRKQQERAGFTYMGAW